MHHAIGSPIAPGRRCLHLARVGLVTALLVALASCSAAAQERSATPSTFASVFASAGPGDTIRLASGDYGTFTGALKHGMVSIAAAPGANVSMKLDFAPASNITLDGLHLRDAEIKGEATKNITIRNSTFDESQLIIRGEEIVDANIVIDHNVFSNFVKCPSCFEGRLQIAERNDQRNGITIQNNLFFGGDSDGIQNGGNGTRIINNEFRDLRPAEHSPGDVHLDSIQLYGSTNTLIKGNYFHDVNVGIMCADGCDHETVEDNVFHTADGSPYAVTWLSDDGSVLQHNTFVDAACAYDQRCGTLYLGNKGEDPASRGTVVRDNILNQICVCQGSVSGLAHENFNLFRVGGSGSQDRRGLPTYVGGAHPTSYAGYALAARSIGKGAASDGRDLGIRVGEQAGPPPAMRVRVLSSLRSIRSSGRLRLSIELPAAGRLTVGATIRPGPAVRAKRHSRRPIRLPARAFGPRSAGAHTVSFRLSRSARRTLGRSRSARLSARVTVGSTTSRQTVAIRR